jgi:hypothetical protein
VDRGDEVEPGYLNKHVKIPYFTIHWIWKRDKEEYPSFFPFRLLWKGFFIAFNNDSKINVSAVPNITIQQTEEDMSRQ